MTLKNDKYAYRVIWSGNDQAYLGLCAEFPSLSWLAETPEAALKGIRKVVSEGVKILETDGEPTPNPYPIENIAANFWIYPKRKIRCRV